MAGDACNPLNLPIMCQIMQIFALFLELLVGNTVKGLKKSRHLKHYMIL
jgi:hypothetical protein